MQRKEKQNNGASFGYELKHIVLGFISIKYIYLAIFVFPPSKIK